MTSKTFLRFSGMASVCRKETRKAQSQQQLKARENDSSHNHTYELIFLPTVQESVEEVESFEPKGWEIRHLLSGDRFLLRLVLFAQLSEVVQESFGKQSADSHSRLLHSVWTRRIPPEDFWFE